ncbi:MAG: GNAT family N-acetyltransferase [Candidatus Bipolaricaulaceae bacterium]
MRFEPIRARLRTGGEVLVRPASPEDFSRWCEMIRACSKESLWQRFECRSAEAILQRAAQGFARKGDELILVAEVEGRMAGEARLCVIPEENAAEFCVLVADPWQGLGLGTLLTDLALEWAKKLGIGRVLVEVVPDNLRILRFLSARGFRFFGHEENRVFWGELRLTPENSRT